MILGIFGNLLTIVALVRCPKVRNVAADFIISLCAADCLFCILVLPFMALRYIRGAWTHGDGLLCTFVPFVQYGNVGVSLLCIAMITINRWNQQTNIYTNERRNWKSFRLCRYIMIAHHSMYARIYKRRWIVFMIAFCWIFSYGFQLPTLFKVWGKIIYYFSFKTWLHRSQHLLQLNESLKCFQENSATIRNLKHAQYSPMTMVEAVRQLYSSSLSCFHA